MTASAPVANIEKRDRFIILLVLCRTTLPAGSLFIDSHLTGLSDASQIIRNLIFVRHPPLRRTAGGRIHLQEGISKSDRRCRFGANVSALNPSVVEQDPSVINLSRG